ncbi:unnamed protein product [Hymenolepis diminuta]|uniref:Uncharacterized protein n=1 Tax=Hymenolepis diminuta TaxID=6216 RepID=A0A564Y3R5_HYMDI|nr:unnamed protein product [Hymenolepis diminuta]
MNREQDAQRKLNSEQLQLAIDENSTCTARELNKTIHVSSHMTIYREMKIVKGKFSPLTSHDLSETNSV